MSTLFFANAAPAGLWNAHATGELVMAANVWKLFDVAVENASEAAIDRLATVLVDLAGLA
jgi:hypothetical protein